MVEITVLKTFRDVKDGVIREPGTKFKAKLARAEEIKKKLPGFVEFKKPSRPKEEDLLEEIGEKFTNPELAEILDKPKPKRGKRKTKKKE